MELFEDDDEDNRNQIEYIIDSEYHEIAKNALIGDQFHLVILEGARNKLNSIKIFSLEVNITFA